MRKQPLLCIGIVLLFHVSLQAQGENIRFKRFGPREGVFDLVFDIYQDAHGYIWMQNYYRYDGQEIKSYPNGNGFAVRVGELLAESWGKEPDSLYYYDPLRDAFIDNYPSTFQRDLIYDKSKNNHGHVLKDASKNLWFRSDGKGVYLYQRATKSFTQIRHREGVPGSLSSDHVSTIVKDRQEQIWVSTWDAGLNLWLKDSTFLPFRHEPKKPNSISSDTIFILAEDHRGIIWIGSSMGLDRLDPKTKTISKVSFPESIVYKGVGKIFIDSSGKLWMLTDSGVITYDPDSGDFQQPFIDENGNPIYPTAYPYGFFSMLEDDQKRIWMGTPAWGLYVFDPVTKKTTHLQNDPADPESRSDNNIRPFMKDRDGRIWIGTFNGVSMYDPNDKKFVHLESDKERKLFFNGHSKSAGLVDRNGNIWIAEYGSGLIRYNPKSEEFDLYKNITGAIFRLTEDQAGNFWVMSTAQDVHVFNPATGKFVWRANHNLTAAYIDAEGKTWMGGPDGLFTFSNPEADPVRVDWNSFKGSSGDFRYDATKILESCSNDIWIATFGQGLIRYDRKTQSVTQHLSDIKNPHSIGGDEMWNIWLDHNCNIWIPLQGKGLAMIPPDQQDKPDPVFKFWNTDNSNLPDNGVMDVVQDNKGRIWVASGSAVSQFEPAANSFHVYGLEEGMKTAPQGLIAAGTGRIYIRGNNGIGYFHPDSLAVNPHIPPVYLKKIRINGRTLPVKGSPGDTLPFPSPLERSISLAESIRLKHWQNEISLEFVALNYTAPTKNRFKYQLIGYDEAWKETDAAQPFATYTNLSPKTYTFRVQGANNDGVWNEEGATLQITILPPWYWAWWSRSLYFLLILGLFYTFYRFQLNRRLATAEARRLQELDRFKTRLYTNITHEFRTPLTVISGMADQVLNNPKDWFREGLVMIKRNSQELLRLVNQMLELSKLESGSLPVNLIHDDIIAYLRYLAESFYSYAESKDIRLHLLTELAALHMDFDPEKIQTIFSNLVGNAIKFTPAGGDVYISVQNAPNTAVDPSLLIRIKDNGIGISPEQLPFIFDRFYQADNSVTRREEGAGIGLALTKELVSLLGGAIEVSSQLHKGAAFTLRFPIRQEAKRARAMDAAGIEPFFVPGEAPSFEGKPSEAVDPDRPLALLIEDNADVLEYLAACLQGRYRLETAANGREGVEKAIELVPDIVVSDVMMPEKDGFEVVKALRNEECTSHIPIILLTAKADMESRLEGLESGADAYLAKPFDKKELEIRLRKLIELRQNLQAQYRNLAPEATVENSPVSREDAFLLKVRQIVEENLSDESFGPPQLCRAMAISRTQLHRKLKALTGESTSLVIRSIRLQKARQLLEKTDLNVSEVGYAVGFTNRSHFTQVFTEEFGEAPSRYRKGT